MILLFSGLKRFGSPREVIRSHGGRNTILGAVGLVLGLVEDVTLLLN
jgi:hypothetical protein